MNSDNNNYEVTYCPEDDEYRVYCNICDKLCFKKYHEKHLKSGTHTNKFYKGPGLKYFKRFLLYKFVLAL